MTTAARDYLNGLAQQLFAEQGQADTRYVQIFRAPHPGGNAGWWQFYGHDGMTLDELRTWRVEGKRNRKLRPVNSNRAGQSFRDAMDAGQVLHRVMTTEEAEEHWLLVWPRYTREERNARQEAARQARE